MHIETKRRLRARAEAIGRLATTILNHYEGDEEVAGAMKYSWLMLRGAKSLRQRWGDDDLELDEAQVRGFVWQHQDSLGFESCHLLPEEREIIAWHNQEAAAISSTSRTRHTSNVVALSPRA